MIRHIRWLIVGACAVLILVAGLIAWRLHARRLAEETARSKAEAAARALAEEIARQAREAKASAEREEVYRQFGLDQPGTRLFVPLEPQLLACNQGRAKLGEKLFNDRRLTSSRVSQGTVCGACHHLGAGGTDSKIHHGVLTRPVYNAPFATSYLHDGSLTNLHEAVTMMIEHPHFSGGGSLAIVTARLAEDAVLSNRFRFVYKDGLAGTNVVDAVTEYMKTLITANTAYDFWCAGDTERLSPEARHGSEVFLAARCMDCHDGPVLGARKVSRGRKVPALRGLGRRKAFLTEGKVKDLNAVVPVMPGGDALPPEDKKTLVEFLKAL